MRPCLALLLALLAACAAPHAIDVEVAPELRAHVARAEVEDGRVEVTLHGLFLRPAAERRYHIVMRDENGAIVTEQDSQARLVHDGGAGTGVDRASVACAVDTARIASVEILRRH